jgi:hypothetical protein
MRVRGKREKISVLPKEEIGYNLYVGMKGREKERGGGGDSGVDGVCG